MPRVPRCYAKIQLIPQEAWSPEQKAFCRTVLDGNSVTLYRWEREPSHVEDFEWNLYYGPIAIWHANETILHVTRQEREERTNPRIKVFNKRFISFTIAPVGPVARLLCTIYGKTKTVIAETAVFYWSLRHYQQRHHPRLRKHVPPRYLEIGSWRRGFDMAVDLSSEQLADILKSNYGTRRIVLKAGLLNADQCVVLATRSGRLHVELSSGVFSDGGNAFVDALEARESCFGIIRFTIMDNYSNGPDRIFPNLQPFSLFNLQRLLQLRDDLVDRLDIQCRDRHHALLPFSAKTSKLYYRMNVTHMQPEEFDSLDIVTKGIHLFIMNASFNRNDSAVRFNRLAVSFLNRVAELGYLKTLGLTMDRYDVAPVAEALIRAIHANPKLSYLDLSDRQWSSSKWVPHLEQLFAAMEDHKGLRTVLLQSIGCLPSYSSIDFGRPQLSNMDFTLLEKLLTRNRNITVLDELGRRYSNGRIIQNLYWLNHCYNGSAKLAKEATSLRPQLVATALEQSASNNFPFTALLLLKQMDVLCEFLEGWDQEEEHIILSGEVEAAVF